MPRKKGTPPRQAATAAPQLDLAVDWEKIPLLAALYPNYVPAFHRCGTLNPELKLLRPKALQDVTEGIDEILRPVGFVRDGLTWHSRPQPGTHDNAAPLPAEPGVLAWLFGRAAKTAAKVYVFAGSNDGSASLWLQKSKYHGGFFVNVDVRNVGRHDPSGSATDGGMRRYRSQAFIPDVPRNYKVDEYHYVRLAEDPRYLAFLLNLIEDRIRPFLQAYADASIRTDRLPHAAEMVEGRPLRLPVKERWRMFEFQPTAAMFEEFSRKSEALAFALRDGRAFQGAIKRVEDGRLLLSWATPDSRAQVQGAVKASAGEEWVTFSQVDPGSLSYVDRGTEQFYHADFTVDVAAPIAPG